MTPSSSPPQHRRFGYVALLLALALAYLGWWAAGQPVVLPDVPGGKFQCVSYAPFHDGETPFELEFLVPPERIESDLTLLRERVNCVRIYATDQGLDMVVPIAERLGLKVMLGAWIGREPANNAQQVSTAIAFANAYPDTVRALVVGNEVLLRGEMPPSELADLIRRVREETGVVVTYADVWEFWMHYPEVAQAVDLMIIHILPFWEDDPVSVSEAMPHVATVMTQVEEAFPEKTIVIGETGWPSAGRMREAALPGRVNQVRYMRDFAVLADREGWDYNLVEAFDQPWKRVLEGTVGGHWGLYTADREPKVTAVGPVSEMPDWLTQFAIAGALGALPLLWLFLAAWRLPPWRWLATALAAQIVGAAMVRHLWFAEVTSRTFFEWAACFGRIGLTALAGALFVAWLARLTDAPVKSSLRQAMRWIRRPGSGRIPRPGFASAVLILSGIWLAWTLLTLVFDPRYRDFPSSGFLVPAAAFALIALFSVQHGSPAEDRREEGALALLLILGGIVLIAKEGLENTQALAFTAIVWLMALPFALTWRRAKRDSARNGA